MSRHARMIRTAISPRLAMRILFKGSSGEPVAGPDRLCILAFALIHVLKRVLGGGPLEELGVILQKGWL